MSVLLITFLSSFVCATSATIDVTPPMGKVVIKNATTINNIHYVDTANIEVIVDAKDDVSPAEDLQYYISTTAISDNQEITTWYDYEEGKVVPLEISTTGTTTIYAVFKDATGNTSLIYSGANVQYEIVYNKNADDAVDISSTVSTTAYYGMPFMITMQAPTRPNYYFKGWSTNPSATDASYKKGELIPADAFMGGSKTINLYAVWAQSSNGSVLLSDVAEIGDYVAYPVNYDNVYSYNNNYKSPYSGWRVISKDVDLDGNEAPGTVNLVSAGVPMTYKPDSSKNTNSVTALTTNFLTTELSNGVNNKYQSTGFLLYQTLTDVFTNKYTATKSDGVTPQVRAMVQEDIFRVTGHTSMATGTTMKLSDAKYEELFKNGAYYWLASPYGSSAYLWNVGNDGDVGGNNSYTYGVRPVVSLKSDVVTTGQDMVGAWILE